MFKAISKLKYREKSYDVLRRELIRWYGGHSGRQFLALAQPRLEEILSNLFGYYLLQIGDLGDNDLISASRIKRPIILDSQHASSGQCYQTLSCEVNKLPIATDSVDVVVLPHTLEIHQDAHQIVREIDRVLLPEGHVVVIGFNPYSLWGMSMWLRRMVGRLPWHGRFLSPWRVKDWFELLGYDLKYMDSYFYRPPLRYPRLMEKMMFMERWGARFWPILGGGYILVAKKQVSTPTPIRPNWQQNRRFRAVGVARSMIQRDVHSEKD